MYLSFFLIAYTIAMTLLAIIFITFQTMTVLFGYCQHYILEIQTSWLPWGHLFTFILTIECWDFYSAWDFSGFLSGDSSVLCILFFLSLHWSTVVVRWRLMKIWLEHDVAQKKIIKGTCWRGYRQLSKVFHIRSCINMQSLFMKFWKSF